MKNITTFLSILILFSSVCFAQDFKNRFAKMVEEKDTINIISLLEEWEKTAPTDPDLFISYFNYYSDKDVKKALSLDKMPHNELSLEVKDSTGQVVGYMNDKLMYNLDNVQKSFEYINKGITLYPDRLDMRLGKMYMLAEIWHYDQLTNELLQIIQQSNKNKNQWLWADAKPYPNAEEFMLGVVHSYVVQLFNTEEKILWTNIKKITETVLKSYPKHIQSLSDQAIVYIFEKQYAKALKPLLKAEKISPEDYIILHNIAYCYEQQNKKSKAIEYYNLVIKYCPDEAKEQMQTKIKTLK